MRYMHPLDDYYANNGYQRVFNYHGIRCLDRGVDIPDPALAIGFGEVLAPVPLTAILRPIMRAPVVRPIDSIDRTYVKTQGGGVKLDQFPMVAYYGEPYGG